jgi:hypothetical protein
MSPGGVALTAIEVAGNALCALPDAASYPPTRHGWDALVEDLRRWHQQHRLPALRRLTVARGALSEPPPAAPALLPPLAVTVICAGDHPVGDAAAALGGRPRRRPETAVVVAVLDALSAAWAGPLRPALVVAGLMGATGCSRSSGYRAVSDAAAAGLIAWDPRTNALERVSDPEIAA